MKKVLILLLLQQTASAGSVTYYAEGIWTGGNSSSSAPSPSCVFDLNPNVVDARGTIRLESDASESLPEVCYDEYIPDGSRGWVHAVIFRKAGQP